MGCWGRAAITWRLQRVQGPLKHVRDEGQQSGAGRGAGGESVAHAASSLHNLASAKEVHQQINSSKQVRRGSEQGRDPSQHSAPRCSLCED